MKHTFLSFLFLFASAFLYSQKTSYFDSDSVRNYGVLLVEKGSKSNSTGISVKKDGQIIEYTPDDIKGFRFPGGKAYVAKEYQFDGKLKKYFFREIVEGEISLLHLNCIDYKGFFLEKDSVLYQMPRKDEIGQSYHSYLQDLTADFPPLHEVSKLVVYNRKSLSEFVNRFNRRTDCFFPAYSFGLTIGSDLRITDPPVYYSYLPRLEENRINSVFRIGVNYTIPFFWKYLYFENEFNLNYAYSYSYYTENGNNYDMFIRSTYLSIPFLLKYSFPNKNPMFFAILGVQGSFLIYDNSLIYHTIARDNNVVRMDSFEISPQSGNPGVSLIAGIGIEHYLNLYRSLVFSIRYEDFLYSNIYYDRSVVLVTGFKF